MEVYSAKRPVDSRLTLVGNACMAGIVLLLCTALTQRKQAAWAATPETWQVIGGGFEVQVPAEWRPTAEGGVGWPQGPEMKFVHVPTCPTDPVGELAGLTYPKGIPGPQVRTVGEIGFDRYTATLVELSAEHTGVTTVAVVAADPAFGVVYLVMHVDRVVSGRALDLLQRIAATARGPAPA